MLFGNPSDIVELILEAASVGIDSSTMISRTSLSTADLKKYLHILLDYELISYKPVDKTYLTTLKGLVYLEIYIDIRSQTAPNFAQ
jgi:predicted transcriptional regulator